jgi:uncharacterized tellurite resistance protein B-like protein
MAKDFTKYSIEGIAQGLGKARLVQRVVADYASKMNMNYEELKEQWWDNIQGGKGIIRMTSEIDEKNERNYYIDAPIKLKDGTEIAVCNQWGKENFSNFILQAGLLGYEIKADSDEVETIEEITEVTNTNEADFVEGSPASTWKTPEALAFVIRHTMLADGDVIDGELDWMHVAFDEYDEQEIEVRDVWDDVDTKAQLYWKLGYHNTLLVNSISYLSRNLDSEQKSRLIYILMQICAQDNLISSDEYVTLLLIAKNLYPNGAAYPVKDALERAGIEIEE